MNTKKKVLAVLVAVVLALMLVGAVVAVAPVPVEVWLATNRSVDVVCNTPGGELLVESYGPERARITCRVWVER